MWFTASFGSSAANSCMLYYSQASNGLLLLNDSGNAFNAPRLIGNAGSLDQQPVQREFGSSSLAISATHLVLNLAMTFTSGYGGAKNVYVFATNGSLVSGWQARGTWTVPSTAVPDLTITKTHAGNFSQGQSGAAYTITVSNAGEGASIGAVNVIEALPSGLTLVSMAGNGWSCNNNTCTRSDALAAGSSYPTITVTVNVGSSAPSSTINLANVSGGGEANTSNDQATDPSTITALVVTVTADSVTPGSGTGLSQTFALQYSDSNGGGDLTQAWAWFTAGFGSSAASSCMLYYSKASNGLFLLDDSGGTFSAPGLIGNTGTLSNTQCSVNLGSSSLAVSGTHLVLNLAMTFRSEYEGVKNVYLYGTNGRLSSGWSPTLGTWTVPISVATITADSVTPGSGTGLTQTFALQYSDSNGGGDLTQGWCGSPPVSDRARRTAACCITARPRTGFYS